MPRSTFSQASFLFAAASLLPLGGFALAQSNADAVQTIPSLPLAAFQDSLGVNTHIEYTDSKYADAAAVLGDLQFIGVHNLRDGIPNPAKWFPQGQALNAMHMLAANGMRFDFVSDCNSDFNSQIQQLDAIVQTYPGVALSVEGQNEINNFPCNGNGGNEQLAEAFQRRLYAAVHGDSTLRGVPVLYMTGAAPVNLQAQPGLADVENTHPYVYRGEQPYARLASDFPVYFTPAGGLPKQITETGYATLPNPNDPDGVNEPAQAEAILNTYFDAALEGNTRTFVYQLLDPYPDPQGKNSDSNFGFFHLDNSPKIIAWAMRHLAEVFPADKPSAQQSVQASITGLPADTGHTLALTGSDGSIAVFLWNEAPIWDKNSQTLQLVAPVPVQVRINGSWNVSYFTPAEDVTHPVQGVNGQYTGYAATYPTALIFKRR